MRLRLPVVLAALVLGLALALPSRVVASDRLQVYVDATRGDVGASGAIDDPFATIGAAVAAVRGVPGGVDINVAAGTYAHEAFPILIDVDDRAIRGIPGRGSRLRPLIVATPALPAGKAMIAVIADGVAVRNLDLEGGGSFEFVHGDFVTPGFGIYVDTAQRFVVDGVTARGAFNGLFARRSSGDVINSTFSRNAGAGILVAAGDSDHPAVVRVLRNVITLNCIGGAFFHSTSLAELAVPAGIPLTIEARAGSLEVELARNQITGNPDACAAAGTQFFLHVSGDDSVPGSIIASVHDNVLGGNGAEDLAIDSHRVDATDTATATFTGTFFRNSYSADATRRFIGFNFRFCPSPPVSDSMITVFDPGGELTGLTYDATGARNLMTVNGIAVLGSNRVHPCS